MTFFNFHQIIYSLSSITCRGLNLIAVIVFEISWLQNIIMAKFFQRAITQKNTFKKIHQIIYLLSSITGQCLKFIAVIVFEITWLQNIIMTL